MRSARALLPLWNAWYFFALYANADHRRAVLGRTDVTGTLDRYILSKAGQLVDEVTAAMDAYDLSGACERHRGLPRRPQQLVHPPQPGPVLGHRRVATRPPPRTPSTRWPRCSRWCAGWPPRCCPFVTEAVWRGLTGRSDRTAPDRVGAPGRLAGAGVVASRARSGGRYGLGAGGLFGRPFDPQGQRPAGPPAARQPDGGRRRRGPARAVRWI